MNTILIVEDDNHINEMLCELLNKNGYTTTSAYSGTEALLLVSQNNYSVVLLDLMLPGKTGEQVLEEIRKNSTVPVIIMTAITDKETTVKLLRLGADDYIAKPFDTDELIARIEARLRRTTVQEIQETKQFKDITLDIDGFEAFIGSQRVGLSKREFEILRLMMTHPKKVFAKDNIYETVWGGEFLGDDNTVNVHISKLRGKLNAISPNTEYIQTVWGIGFKMKE